MSNKKQNATSNRAMQPQRYSGTHRSIRCERATGFISDQGDTLFTSILEYRAYVVLLQYFASDEIALQQPQELLPQQGNIAAISWKIDFYIRITAPFYVEMKGCNDDNFLLKYNLYQRYVDTPILVVHAVPELAQWLSQRYCKLGKH